MTSNHSNALLVACRRVADNQVMLHVIKRGICVSVALSRPQALRLTHALLGAASPPATEPPPSRQSRGVKARR